VTKYLFLVTLPRFLNSRRAGALKGGARGSSSAASGKVARSASGSGAATAGAAVPAANGAAGGPRRVGSLVWVGIIVVVAAQYGG
jgi:hypothetical protein